MKIISGIGNYREKVLAPSVAIGIFDGVHRGHQALIKAAVEDASARKTKSIVLTFYPHPAHVLRPDIRLPYLNTLDQRIRAIESLGVDIVIVVEFTRDLAQLAAEAFVDTYLAGVLHVGHVFVGKDFRFGQGRGADVAMLRQMGADRGFAVTGVEAVTHDQAPISSTRLRKLIGEGNLDMARTLLGRPFSVEGQVVHGDGRGHGLGFPTANVAVASDVLPPHGVYVVECVRKGRVYPGAANLGVRPYFSGTGECRLEVYILDFDENIYGDTLEIRFLKILRPEASFESKEALLRQIAADVAAVRNFFQE